MGFNLISGCHLCKTKMFHWRKEENLGILDFYIKHRKCARENLDNVQTVMDNNGTDQDWCQDKEYGGYAQDSLVDELRMNDFIKKAKNEAT